MQKLEDLPKIVSDMETEHKEEIFNGIKVYGCKYDIYKRDESTIITKLNYCWVKRIERI